MQTHTDRNRYVEISKVDILMSNLATSMPSTFVNSIILVVVLWKIIPHERLLTWCLVNIIFVLLRYVVIFFYKRDFKKDDYQFWKKSLLISFVIAGFLFGSAGVFLVDLSRYEYVVFLYFIVGGMVVGSVGSYHNNLAVHFSYSGIVFAIPTLAIYSMDSEITTPMVVLGCIFYLLISVSAVRLNRDLRESLILRYDNMLLVDSLNNEKLHTERLNEELMEKNVKLRELSLIDPLTGLKNRRYLFDVVTPEIEAINKSFWCEKSGKNKRLESVRNGYGVFVIDIDYFKRVNDQYGHDSGDIVLEEFGKKLMDQVREDDIVARIGGEEFIIILKNTDAKYLAELAEKLRKNIEKSVFHIKDNRQINTTCSVGFVFYPFFHYYPGNMTFEHILSLADKALYHAKNNGRNMSVKAVSSEEVNKDYDLLMAVTEDLNKAVEQEQIVFEVCTK